MQTQAMNWDMFAEEQDRIGVSWFTLRLKFGEGSCLNPLVQPTLPR